MMRLTTWAILAGWAVAALELLVVAALRHAELTAGWELATGAVFLSPTALLLVVPPALLGALLVLCFENQAFGFRITASVVAFCFGSATAFLVATGRHFAAPGQRAGFATLVGVCAGLGVYGAHPAIARIRKKRPMGAAVGFGALLLASEIGNARLLVRLYPGFHAALAILSVALAALSIAPFVRRDGGSRRREQRLGALVLLVTGLSIATAVPSAHRLSRLDNFRLVMAEGAPLLGHAVLVAARVAPPLPVADVDPCLLSPGACTSRTEHLAGPNFTGRDIVLVTIDALRADHVSAYGYARPTTPHLDALARESVVFDRAYCATPHTSYSVASLMTGKYMRPLLLQGVGADSETLASYLRTYGYRTAAFYPPAVFFIDQERFTSFEHSHFGFEYAKVEFMEGEGRVAQVEGYLRGLADGQQLLLWVHLFGPHEPYEAHPEHPFGDRDIDRYDSEIAAADVTAAAIVDLVRARRPNAIVIVTADHGEEFGEHGGRYHGTSVYEEQVRVPLFVSAPGLLTPRRVQEVVQSVDLLPTILAGLSIPPSPRIRGRNLGPLLSQSRSEQLGFASVETDEWALLAEGPRRLVCARKLGACRLYDEAHDPTERDDLSGRDAATFSRMRAELQALGASHGSFETTGMRTETGRGWPGPILRGIAGDADAAPDLAALLDDADRDIRRKAAELLFELKRSDTMPALRLSLSRDEDVVVKRYAALALTRMGETVPLAADLLNDTDIHFRRLSALALAENGDKRGESVLIDFFRHRESGDFERSLDLLHAFSKIRSKDAVHPLVQGLGDVRLRPYIAETLAAIGDDAARGPLVAALAEERHQTARIAIADALVALHAKEELARPLVRWLGVPDPLPGGLGYAERAGILEFVGGPDAKGLKSLRAQSNLGAAVRILVPKGGNGAGVRVLVRARAEGTDGRIRIGARVDKLVYDSKREHSNTRKVTQISDHDFVSLSVPGSKPGDAAPVEVAATLPASVRAAPGRQIELVVYAERQVSIEAMALVPLADELPPPPPEPWVAGR